MEMFLTVEQCAERLQLTPYTLRKHLAAGKLRGVKRGRVWRVPESALGEAEPQSEVQPDTSPK
jgi:excisionase family DNA binding protein